MVVPLIAATLGVAFGCATKPKAGVWFDACCETCTADTCDGCSEAKGECGDASTAECMVRDDVMMCRPRPAARH